MYVYNICVCICVCIYISHILFTINAIPNNYSPGQWESRDEHQTPPVLLNSEIHHKSKCLFSFPHQHARPHFNVSYLLLQPLPKGQFH